MIAYGQGAPVRRLPTRPAVMRSTIALELNPGIARLVFLGDLFDEFHAAKARLIVIAAFVGTLRQRDLVASHSLVRNFG